MLKNQFGMQVRENGSLTEGIGCGDREKWAESRNIKYGERRKKENIPSTYCVLRTVLNIDI